MLKKLLSFLAIATTVAFSCAHDSVAEEKGYDPQTSNERGLKVTVLLKNFPAETKTWDFEVALETHTQALNDDLVKSSVLIAGGKQYLPIALDGAPPGGHHRKGLLRFKTIVPQPQSIELQIRLAGDTLPRRYKWLLK